MLTSKTKFDLLFDRKIISQMTPRADVKRATQPQGGILTRHDLVPFRERNRDEVRRPPCQAYGKDGCGAYCQSPMIANGHIRGAGTANDWVATAAPETRLLSRQQTATYSLSVILCTHSHSILRQVTATNCGEILSIIRYLCRMTLG